MQKICYCCCLPQLPTLISTAFFFQLSWMRHSSTLEELSNTKNQFCKDKLLIKIGIIVDYENVVRQCQWNNLIPFEKPLMKTTISKELLYSPSLPKESSFHIQIYTFMLRKEKKCIYSEERKWPSYFCVYFNSTVWG